MKMILQIISYLSLLLVVAAPLLYYMGRLSLEQNKYWMLVATMFWFASASCWIGSRKKEESHDA